ncbi:MAG TPA: diacylglycerol kinase family protein [Terriglobales bacterium]|nr:diacylglycerol kinase family protein [Terriglobales bacterium]
MSSATRALLIFNPIAGRNPASRTARVEALARGLRRGGWTVDIAATDAERGAFPAAERGLCAGYSVLVGCGGDGTLNQIAHAIASAPAPHPALAVAPPFGTANVYARAIGCPGHPAAAARWLLRARPQPRPLGLAVTSDGPRHFLAVASIGYDAAVVRDLHPAAKRRWGKLAFVASVGVAWRRYFPASFDYEAGNLCGRADGLMLALTPFYAGRLHLGRPGPDGALALALRGAPRLLPLQALFLLTCGLEFAPGVERLPPGSITVTTPGRPLELDGEFVGATPATLSVVAAAVHVLVGRPPLAAPPDPVS